MKSWFRSIRTGASAQEASRDARLGLEEVEPEHEFEERLFLEEKRKALSYQNIYQNRHNNKNSNNNNKKKKSISFRDDIESSSIESDLSHENENEKENNENENELSETNFELDEWGNPKSNNNDSNGNNDNNTTATDDHNQLASIHIGDIIQALYLDENAWYPAEVIDMNINSDTGEYEFDIKYDGFEGDDAFEYSKNAKEISLSPSVTDDVAYSENYDEYSEFS